MKSKVSPSTSAGAAAHVVLGVAGAVIALWAGGSWLLGLATVTAGHTADALAGVGAYISGATAVVVALAVFLGGVIVLIGTPIWIAALVVRGVEGLFWRVRHAGRS